MKKTGNCVHLRIRWLLKMWLAMRFLMFFLLLSVVPVSASVFGQDAKVSLQGHEHFGEIHGLQVCLPKQSGGIRG